MSEINLNYLNNERIEAFKRIEGLEQSIKKITDAVENVKSIAEHKITDDTKSAQDAAVRARSFSDNAEQVFQEIKGMLSEINPIIDDYKAHKKLLSSAIKKSQDFEEKYNLMIERSDSVVIEQSKIQNLQSQINTELERAQSSKSRISSMEADATTTTSKISDLHTKSLEYKGNIEQLYNKILGYDREDGTHEEGLKEQLEKSYQDLTKTISDTQKHLEQLELNYNNTFNEKKKSIEELLPDALTAGLASAYAAKKNHEKEQLKTYRDSFTHSIYGLIGISLIPLIVNLILYFKYNYTLPQIFAFLPTSLAFVLPLYFPTLWLAWNANKELKLSKRLIEEYTHKEVMSRTYQGLAQQVKDLNADDISNQLKDRLLHNLITVNSENPGKLISDYNKTDNPLMEILDKSIALSDIFKKLGNIPGFGKLSIYLRNKEEKKLEELEEKASKGLEIQKVIENEN